jgi:1-acyl-sn-glycerol-3-phosphate acyltransferase
MLQSLRCALFSILYNAAGFWFGLTGWLLGWLPYKPRAYYIRQWNFFALFLAKHLVGVKVELRGGEHIPDSPCVIMSKHQSQWETFYLQTIFPMMCTILKKELLDIPFFGWGLRKLEPIAIDRSNPKQALRAIQKTGLQRVQQGRSVLIFPEGTRIPYGQKGNYARSGSSLAIEAQIPVLPIAHNAGYCWPSDKFVKRRGTITISIGKPIESEGKTSRELTEQVERWIETECANLQV